MPEKNEDVSREAHAARPLLIAYLMFGVALAIMFLGLTPIDLATWMAATLAMPIGVPYLVASALCFGAAWILTRVGYRRRHRIVRGFAMVFGCFSLVFSATTITTFV